MDSFEIGVDDVKFLRGCMDAIVNLVEEGALEIGADAISVKAMDPSQIAMVVFSAPKDAFSNYKVSGTTKLGVNFADLSKILGRARAKDKLVITQQENKLVLEFAGAGAKRHFSLPLLESSAAVQREPRVEHDASVKMRGSEFKEMLRDVALVSSHLTLHAKGKEFSMNAKGDSAEMDSVSEKGEKGDFEVSAKGEARATFPLQYLDDITKACPDDSQLMLSLRTNAPLKLSYGIGKASVIYYLAPRIESE
ncbi:MAG: proliferating cell nuclear antigen (pcna) [Candidatus Burarchaeum sp.]|nr:proliferating cell nuclear antigen (pcna) [Candidatus Burarchaeum sp.]MDO8339439.1 proliferating cell nuclear antigen (pcna) [Candidatus Burarchaeum sp.]